MNKYKFLLRELRPYKVKIIIMLILTTISIIISLLYPYLNKYIVDEVIIKGNLKLLISIIIALFMFFILSSVFEIINSYLFCYITNKMLYQLKIKQFRKILKKDINFFTRIKIGEIISRIQSETQDIIGLLGSFNNLYNQIINILITIVILFSINIKISLLIILGIPIILITTIRTNPKIRKKNEDLLILNSNISNILQDNLSGINTIKIFRLKKYPLLRFSEELKLFINKSFELYKIQVISTQILSFAYFVLPVLIIAFGALLIKQKIITVGDIVVITSYVNRLYSNTSSLINIIFSLQKSIASINRLGEIYKNNQDDENKNKTVEIQNLNKIILDNVTFGFEEGKEVIKNFTYRLEKGKITCIIGPNGSGKTTLLNLVAGIYTPLCGNIFYDNTDIRNVKDSSIRKLVGYINQDIWLFNDSIYNNITFGKQIKLDSFLGIFNFDMKLSQIIERNGSNISGGQKQKIAILRGLINEPQVLLIDEAFSNLDIQSREMLFRYLNKIKKDKIIVIVSHDEESLKFADDIIYLDRRYRLDPITFILL